MTDVTHQFDAEIVAAAVAATVPAVFLKAIVACESGFNPRARRGESQIGDASYGLTQVLGRTARALGYIGPFGDLATRTGGLFDPVVNLTYGAKFLADVLRQVAGDLECAASAYNGGMRPHLAFGSRATRPVTVCLAWKASAPTTGRTLARDCAAPFTAQVGQFGNQPYVDRVMRYCRAYAAAGFGA